MPQFQKSTVIAAPPDRVFRLHQGKDALARLVPPWEDVRVSEAPDVPLDGTTAVLSVGFGPFRLRWVARHEGYSDRGALGGEFTDVQVAGPFRRWRHHHLIAAETGGGTRLTDTIDYELPLGPLGRIFGERLTRRKIERMFEFRHAQTKAAAEAC